MSQAATPNENLNSRFVDARYVWAPEAHRLYREECSFFLIRLKAPGPDRREHLDKILRQVSLTSRSIYDLFGHHDYLIKIWATQQKRARLLRLFEKNSDFIQDIAELRCKAIDYFWPVTSPANSTLADANLAKIKEFCQTCQSNEEPPMELEDHLKKNGILFCVPNGGRALGTKEMSAGRYRFYIGVTRVPGHSASPARKTERAVLANFLRRISEKVNQVSLYDGFGFSDYLIKGVVNDFYTIESCNTELIGHISEHDLGMRTETFLVATDTPQENDIIDVSWEDFTDAEVKTEESLDTDQRLEHFAALNKNFRRNISQAFVDNEPKFKGTAFEGFFRDLLFARISCDTDLLCKALSMTSRLEHYLRTYFRNVWLECLGKDLWYQKASEAAIRTKCIVVGQKLDTKKITIKDLISISGVIPEVQLKISGTLGERWLSYIEAILPFRNDFSHGTVYDSDSYLTDNWDRLCESFVSIGALFNRLNDLEGSYGSDRGNNDSMLSTQK